LHYSVNLKGQISCGGYKILFPAKATTRSLANGIQYIYKGRQVCKRSVLEI